jgi:hypothetical protein
MGEGSGVGGTSQDFKKDSPPTRLASLATLPAARFARGGRETRVALVVPNFPGRE